MRNLISILIVGSSFVIGACANSDGAGDDSAETAVDSAESTSAEANMMMAAVDGSDSASAAAVSVDVVVGRIAANLSARFEPASCLTVTQTGIAITAVYNDCTGVHGLAHVSGELDLAISIALDGAIIVHGTSSNLKVNGAELSVDATATYSSGGPSSRKLVVTTEGSGTGPRGRTVDHDGSYTITWDRETQCHTITGSWSTEIGARTRSNEVNLSRCGSGCPTGSVVHSFLRGESLDVEFNGTATASWSASSGASGTLALSCM